MKTVTSLFVLLFISIFTFGQSPAYQNAMALALKNMQAAKGLPELQTVANQFDRISNAEQKEWLPGYYASLTLIHMSFMEKESVKRDMYLDKAQQYIDQIQKLVPNESEIYALQGFLYQARIQVSPMDRGQQYFMLAEEAFGKAKTLNPENPRPYYLSGQSKFYMPSAFGGGPAAALPLLTTAKQKFDTFKPASTLAPNWGLSSTEFMLQKCQEQQTATKN